ncbi:hypothetical protein [Microbaculum marinum]|uniref:Uncharacterized protein n=1 Tax=Microbaculum marinum TaxID=1764581 RepID=A0AAW9RPI1_9HYPH
MQADFGAVPERGQMFGGGAWRHAAAPALGGFGPSGLGCENGREAIEEPLETKTVWIELSGATRDPFTIG